MRAVGLEPTRHKHTPLKRACLPIPACSLIASTKRIISLKQPFVNLFFKIFSVYIFHINAHKNYHALMIKIHKDFFNFYIFQLYLIFKLQIVTVVINMNIKRIASAVLLIFLALILMICIFENSEKNSQRPGGFMAEGIVLNEKEPIAG